MKRMYALALGAGAMAVLVLAACSADDAATMGSQSAKVTPGTVSESRSGAQADMAANFAPPMPMGMSMPMQMAEPDREKYSNVPLNSVKSVATEPVSTFSIDVDTASYANARRFLNDGTLPPRDAVRVEEFINYFDYHYEKPENAKTPFRATTVLTPSPWSEDRKILHIGLQGYDIPRKTQPPLNLVFLIDTSGSMQSEDKLPLLKKTLNLLIDQLGNGDHVSIVAYAGSAGEVLGPTTGKDKHKIRSALNALSSGGSTAGGEGLALAYALGKENFDAKAVNRVILLTDGDFNVGVTDNQKLEDFVAEKRKTGIYLSVYGFGQGNYNDAMMQTIAQSGNGTAAYIDTMQEARKLLRDDLSGSLFPIADDVKIQIEFNPAEVAEYRLIGYETRMLNREDFNNDQVDAGEVGSGVSVTALYEITPRDAKLSSDPLRYQNEPPQKSMSDELGFLKIRYKRPGESSSHLISQPVSSHALASVAAAPEATRWALAVAGFGERLRGSPYLSDKFDYDAIGALAQGARGTDEYGLRAEFVQLVRAAKTAKSVNE